MGTDVGLFIERRSGTTWVNPTELRSEFPRPYASSLSCIEVCWWPLRWPQTSLFFGPNAVFPFVAGVPADVCPELKQRVWANADDNPRHSGWIMVEDLCLDLWESETALVESSVPARLADVFGSGEEARVAVEALLARRGTDWQASVDRTRRPELTSLPQDWAVRRRHELFSLSSEQIAPVTYRQTLASFAGPLIWDQGLARLRGRAGAHTYRLISALG